MSGDYRCLRKREREWEKGGLTKFERGSLGDEVYQGILREGVEDGRAINKL